jgi:hypothetical protein
MRLFHRKPPPRPALRRRVPRPWDPPQTQFPGIVPINVLQLGQSGRVVTSDGPHGESEPTGPTLRPRGGGGTSHYQRSQWWAWPLPPSGPLEFICHWPTLGTGDQRAGIDAQLILDAARRSVQLWPEGDG